LLLIRLDLSLKFLLRQLLTLHQVRFRISRRSCPKFSA